MGYEGFNCTKILYPIPSLKKRSFKSLIPTLLFSPDRWRLIFTASLLALFGAVDSTGLLLTVIWNFGPPSLLHRCFSKSRRSFSLLLDAENADQCMNFMFQSYIYIFSFSFSDHIQPYSSHCRPRQVLACYLVEGTDNWFLSGYVLSSCPYPGSSLWADKYVCICS